MFVTAGIWKPSHEPTHAPQQTASVDNLIGAASAPAPAGGLTQPSRSMRGPRGKVEPSVDFDIERLDERSLLAVVRGQSLGKSGAREVERRCAGVRCHV